MWAFAYVGLIIAAVLIGWAAQREFRCPRCGYHYGDDYLEDQKIKARGKTH